MKVTRKRSDGWRSPQVMALFTVLFLFLMQQCGVVMVVPSYQLTDLLRTPNKVTPIRDTLLNVSAEKIWDRLIE
jgi:hypothetical protein